MSDPNDVHPGFMPDASELHRAVEKDPPDLDDFRPVAELRLAAGKKIKPDEAARRSFMEGISTDVALVRARWINDNVLKPRKPHIAVLSIPRLVGIEAEHTDDGHHDLYGDRGTMTKAVLHCEPADT